MSQKGIRFWAELFIFGRCDKITLANMLNMGLFELLKFIGQSLDKCTSIFWPIQFSIKLLLCHMHTFCIRPASPLCMYIAKVYGNLKTFTFCSCVWRYCCRRWLLSLLPLLLCLALLYVVLCIVRYICSLIPRSALLYGFAVKCWWNWTKNRFTNRRMSADDSPWKHVLFRVAYVFCVLCYVTACLRKQNSLARPFTRLHFDIFHVLLSLSLFCFLFSFVSFSLSVRSLCRSVVRLLVRGSQSVALVWWLYKKFPSLFWFPFPYLAIVSGFLWLPFWIGDSG